LRALRHRRPRKSPHHDEPADNESNSRVSHCFSLCRDINVAAGPTDQRKATECSNRRYKRKRFGFHVVI
jgi:hypothetical protein